ncbi:hypothetical protein [Leucobacter sp. 1207-22]
MPDTSAHCVEIDPRTIGVFDALRVTAVAIDSALQFGLPESLKL